MLKDNNKYEENPCEIFAKENNFGKVADPQCITFFEKMSPIIGIFETISLHCRRFCFNVPQRKMMLSSRLCLLAFYLFKLSNLLKLWLEYIARIYCCICLTFSKRKKERKKIVSIAIIISENYLKKWFSIRIC